jgi:hypothetical protein
MGDPVEPWEIELERLESVVVAGQRALASRNDLVYRLLSDGEVGPFEVTHRLNRVRALLGADRLSFHAVGALRRRRDKECAGVSEG